MNGDWTYDELVNVQRLMERYKYTREEIDEIFSLYNRINKTNKQPTGCGKCVVNALNNLRYTYGREKTKRETEGNT